MNYSGKMKGDVFHSERSAENRDEPKSPLVATGRLQLLLNLFGFLLFLLLHCSEVPQVAPLVYFMAELLLQKVTFIIIRRLHACVEIRKRTTPSIPKGSNSRRSQQNLKILLDGLVTEKMFRRGCKLAQLEMDEESPNNYRPHLLKRTC